MDENLIRPPEEDPFLPEIQDFWSGVGKDMVRNSIKTIDETAKQIIGVAGILEGLYFHAIAFTDLRGQVAGGGELLVYLAPILLLLLSLSAALLVFLPDAHPFDLRAWEAAKLIHERVKKSKLLLLRIASISLMLGVAALFAAMTTYLLG